MQKIIRHQALGTPAEKKLVLVCAWCPTTRYPQLQKGERYTHGICVMHKHELVQRLALNHAHRLSN